MRAESTESCSWCGEPIEREDGYRVAELPGDRRAAFCRLEHVVPWHIQGPRWEASNPRIREAWTPSELPPGLADSLDSCAHCGEPLGEVRVLVVRHRGEHRIPDAFCSADHLAEWAKSGGRWR